MFNNWKSENDSNLKAIAILRVSSKGQENNVSHSVQESEIKSYCLRNNLNIIKIFQITESAKDSDHRKQYNAAMNYAEDNKIKHILFYMKDRETRNLTDNENNEKLVKLGKIVIHYVNDRVVLWEHSADNDFFISDIKATLAKNFIRDLTSKVDAAQKRKAELGHFPGNKPPLGYLPKRDLNSDGREKKKGMAIIAISPNQAKVELVNREFQLRALGHSYEVIHKMVVKEQMPQKAGLNQYVRSAVEKRLTNPFYWGRFEWQGLMYEGKHPRIIPDDILDKVKAINDKRVLINRSNQAAGLYTNWIRCGYPGCGMMIVYDPKKKKLKDGTIRIHHYYRCSDGRKVHDTLAGQSITEEKLNQEFQRIIDKIPIDPSRSQELFLELEAIDKAAKLSKVDDIKSAEERIKELQRKEDKIYEDHNDGLLTKEQYLRQMNRIRAEITEYEDKLKDNGQAHRQEILPVVQKLIEPLIHLKSNWLMTEQEERVKLLKSVESNQQLWDGSVEYNLGKKHQTVLKMFDKIEWRPQGDSNPRRRRERAVSWAG